MAKHNRLIDSTHDRDTRDNCKDVESCWSNSLSTGSRRGYSKMEYLGIHAMFVYQWLRKCSLTNSHRVDFPSPPRRPDLAPCVFFNQVISKRRVYSNNSLIYWKLWWRFLILLFVYFKFWKMSNIMTNSLLANFVAFVRAIFRTVFSSNNLFHCACAKITPVVQ